MVILNVIIIKAAIMDILYRISSYCYSVSQKKILVY